MLFPKYAQFSQKVRKRWLSSQPESKLKFKSEESVKFIEKSDLRWQWSGSEFDLGRSWRMWQKKCWSDCWSVSSNNSRKSKWLTWFLIYNEFIRSFHQSRNPNLQILLTSSSIFIISFSTCKLRKKLIWLIKFLFF